MRIVLEEDVVECIDCYLNSGLLLSSHGRTLLVGDGVVHGSSGGAVYLVFGDIVAYCL